MASLPILPSLVLGSCSSFDDVFSAPRVGISQKRFNFLNQYLERKCEQDTIKLHATRLCVHELEANLDQLTQAVSAIEDQLSTVSKTIQVHNEKRFISMLSIRSDKVSGHGKMISEFIAGSSRDCSPKHKRFAASTEATILDSEFVNVLSIRTQSAQKEAPEISLSDTSESGKKEKGLIECTNAGTATEADVQNETECITAASLDMPGVPDAEATRNTTLDMYSADLTAEDLSNTAPLQSSLVPAENILVPVIVSMSMLQNTSIMVDPANEEMSLDSLSDQRLSECSENVKIESTDDKRSNLCAPGLQDLLTTPSHTTSTGEDLPAETAETVTAKVIIPVTSADELRGDESAPFRVPAVMVTDPSKDSDRPGKSTQNFSALIDSVLQDAAFEEKLKVVKVTQEDTIQSDGIILAESQDSHEEQPIEESSHDLRRPRFLTFSDSSTSLLPSSRSSSISHADLMRVTQQLSSVSIAKHSLRSSMANSVVDVADSKRSPRLLQLWGFTSTVAVASEPSFFLSTRFLGPVNPTEREKTADESAKRSSVDARALKVLSIRRAKTAKDQSGRLRYKHVSPHSHHNSHFDHHIRDNSEIAPYHTRRHRRRGRRRGDRTSSSGRGISMARGNIFQSDSHSTSDDFSESLSADATDQVVHGVRVPPRPVRGDRQAIRWPQRKGQQARSVRYVRAAGQTWRRFWFGR